MTQSWKITVWGVRGSAPKPSPDCMEYGGNTSCISLEYGNHIVILDAGTGLAPLGQALAARRDVKRLDILISHVHIDHVLGLFSFLPFFDPDMELHFYGGSGLARCLETLIGPPFWPLGLSEFSARLKFHELRPGDCFDLGGLAVSTMAGSHPGNSIMYRLEADGKCLTYTLDCEADLADCSALARFAWGSDLLVWDAGFTQADLRPGWGHSTWEQGAALGSAAQVKQVLMTHYGWNYTDEFLRRQELLAGRNDICRFAKEGMMIVL